MYNPFRMFGSKEKRRKRALQQLHVLGRLLARMSLVEALDLLDTGFGNSDVPWVRIRSLVAEGSTLSSAFSRAMGPEDAPAEGLEALRAGEQSHDLPHRLASISIEQAELIESSEASDDGSVVGVNELLYEIIKKSSPSAELSADAAGRVTLRIGSGAAWKVLDQDAAGPVWRRLLFLCGIPYWSNERRRGDLKMRFPEGMKTFVVESEPDAKRVRITVS